MHRTQKEKKEKSFLKSETYFFLSSISHKLQQMLRQRH